MWGPHLASAVEHVPKGRLCENMLLTLVPMPPLHLNMGACSLRSQCPHAPASHQQSWMPGLALAQAKPDASLLLTIHELDSGHAILKKVDDVQGCELLFNPEDMFQIKPQGVTKNHTIRSPMRQDHHLLALVILKDQR